MIFYLFQPREGSGDNVITKRPHSPGPNGSPPKKLKDEVVGVSTLLANNNACFASNLIYI